MLVSDCDSSYTIGVNLWEVGGRDPRFWAGGRVGLQRLGVGRSWTGCEICIISYHVQEFCSKVVTFEEK